MYKCSCGRTFYKKQGLSYHQNYCGKNNIFLDGGYECYIGKDGEKIYIHREVMENKLGRKLKKGELAHHKDNNKRNNNPDNLEVTNKNDHGKHHYKVLTKRRKKEILFKREKTLEKNKSRVRGSKVGTSKLIEKQVIEIKIRLKNGEKYKEISQDYNVHEDTIRYIKNNQTWKHIII